jgi:hypothetical protein
MGKNYRSEGKITRKTLNTGPSLFNSFSFQELLDNEAAIGAKAAELHYV